MLSLLRLLCVDYNQELLNQLRSQFQSWAFYVSTNWASIDRDLNAARNLERQALVVA